MLSYTPHEKLSLRRHPHFNEAWLHDQICNDPTILGLGDLRVLDRERISAGTGRLDLLLFDEDNNRRYETEIMLGKTDPSHIIRCIEYWDVERRRYPGYDHIAVLIAEDVTARFLNVISLLSGSIPIIAIQLDALKVGDHILLNFVNVLDHSELRVDDTEEDSGGGQVDRAFWDSKVGPQLMSVCDQVLQMINAVESIRYELNYLRSHIGLRMDGVVNNIIHFSPKSTKKIVHINFRSDEAEHWFKKLEEEGVNVRSNRKARFRITVSPTELNEHESTIREAVESVAREHHA